jgi:hypothetical protein
MATLVKRKEPRKAKAKSYHERIIVQPMARLAALLKSKTNGRKATSR